MMPIESVNFLWLLVLVFGYLCTLWILNLNQDHPTRNLVAESRPELPQESCKKGPSPIPTKEFDNAQQYTIEEYFDFLQSLLHAQSWDKLSQMLVVMERRNMAGLPELMAVVCQGLDQDQTVELINHYMVENPKSKESVAKTLHQNTIRASTLILCDIDIAIVSSVINKHSFIPESLETELQAAILNSQAQKARCQQILTNVKSNFAKNQLHYLEALISLRFDKCFAEFSVIIHKFLNECDALVFNEPYRLNLVAKLLHITKDLANEMARDWIIAASGLIIDRGSVYFNELLMIAHLKQLCAAHNIPLLANEFRRCYEHKVTFTAQTLTAVLDSTCNAYVTEIIDSLLLTVNIHYGNCVQPFNGVVIVQAIFNVLGDNAQNLLIPLYLSDASSNLIVRIMNRFTVEVAFSLFTSAIAKDKALERNHGKRLRRAEEIVASFSSTEAAVQFYTAAKVKYAEKPQSTV